MQGREIVLSSLALIGLSIVVSCSAVRQVERAVVETRAVEVSGDRLLRGTAQLASEARVDVQEITSSVVVVLASTRSLEQTVQAGVCVVLALGTLLALAHLREGRRG